MDNRYFDYPDGSTAPESDGTLAEIGLLAGSDEADWSLLFDYGERRLVHPGEPIITRGDTDRSLFIVLAGSLRILRPTFGRLRDSVVRVLGPGDVVGEVGFAVGGARSNTITATEVSEVFELEWHAFERMAAAHPGLGLRFAKDVLRIVAARARAAER